MKRNFSTWLLGVLVLGLVPGAMAQQDWQQGWEKTLAAAKKEGRVAVLGPRQVQARDVLVAFEKAYGIKVDYLGDPGGRYRPGSCPKGGPSVSFGMFTSAVPPRV